MKVYLVGGAVRDTLLGLEPKDRDWVVVGATESQILESGFIKINANFPVFLDPNTKEEYALARSEKKIAKGYHGFVTNFSADTKLEDDLLRRDLTINSIAMDSEGNIIDPFNGCEDVKKRILRHTSEAFIEDPLRVVRLARFKAQLNQFKFSIAKETKMLVEKIIKSGELKYLTRERLHIEFMKSLANPKIFFETLNQLKCLEIIFPSIKQNLSKLPNIDFFESGQYIKLTKDEKIALCFLNFDYITPLRQELLLTNKQTKLLKSVINIRKMLANLTNAVKIYESIKNANFIRDHELCKDAFQLYKKYFDIISAKKNSLDSLETVIDNIRKLDTQKVISSTPKPLIKKALDSLYTDTIKKQFKI